MIGVAVYFSMCLPAMVCNNLVPVVTLCCVVSLFTRAATGVWASTKLRRPRDSEVTAGAARGGSASPDVRLHVGLPTLLLSTW